MMLIYQKGEMNLELIHILGKKEEVSGYIFYDFILLFLFSRKKITIDDLIVIVALI